MAAARAGLRQPHAAHAVVVAVGAAATERGGIGIAATAPHSASALAVLALPCALHPGELVGVMVAAVPLAAAQRCRDCVRAIAMHPASLCPAALARHPLALPLR